MVDTQLKEKIHDALTRALFSDPADVVDVSDGELDDDLHLVVISRKFEARGLRDRNDLIWDQLQSELAPDEWGKISLTIGLTPDKVNGAKIRELKYR